MTSNFFSFDPGKKTPELDVIREKLEEFLHGNTDGRLLDFTPPDQKWPDQDKKAA